MKKKTKIAVAILGILGITTSSIMPHVFAEEGEGGTTANMILTINEGDLTIQAPTADAVQSMDMIQTDRNITFSFSSSAFTVKDMKGSNVGYRTSIDISDFKGKNATISRSNIKFQASGVEKISGIDNSNVKVDMSNRQVSSAPLDYIYRANGENHGLVGTYGSPVNIVVNVPEFTPAGEYTSTITYTLYPTYQQ